MTSACSPCREVLAMAQPANGASHLIGAASAAPAMITVGVLHRACVHVGRSTTCATVDAFCDRP